MKSGMDWGIEFNLTSAYNIDCMEYMRASPDKAFDLAVVDPPYGIGESGEKNHTRGKIAPARDYPPFAGGDKEPPGEEYFKELFRVSKNQVIFGANHFISRFSYDSPCWLVWDKDNGDNDFADCELAWTSFPCAVRRFRFRWSGFLQESMKEKEARIHPTQKPVALYTWIFKKFAKDGDRILDTHLGSGSSRIAAYDLGLDFVGCELDPVYFKLQEERFEKHTSQMNLFVD